MLSNCRGLSLRGGEAVVCVIDGLFCDKYQETCVFRVVVNELWMCRH